MKIEVGKYYRTRDGRKVGPMAGVSFKWVRGKETSSDPEWNNDGTCREGFTTYDDDLIAEWTEPETGTLAELDVKPGDVVELVQGITNMYEGRTYTIQQDGKILDNNGSGQYYGFVDDIVDDICYDFVFRIISRASDTPKPWGEMTDAEKGELLLAHHEGETIEFNNGSDEWVPLSWDFDWLDEHAYRIKPEPVRETVTLYGVNGYQGDIEFDSGRDFGDWRITFTTTDGKPDLDSIKMEEV